MEEKMNKKSKGTRIMFNTGILIFGVIALTDYGYTAQNPDSREKESILKFKSVSPDVHSDMDCKDKKCTSDTKNGQLEVGVPASTTGAFSFWGLITSLLPTIGK